MVRLLFLKQHIHNKFDGGVVEKYQRQGGVVMGYPTLLLKYIILKIFYF